MIHHYCKILVKTDRQWILSIEIEKNWSRHDIISNSIKRGYLTRDEAECCMEIHRSWSNSLPKNVIPIDRTQYQWKDTIDRYVLRSV